MPTPKTVDPAAERRRSRATTCALIATGAAATIGLAAALTLQGYAVALVGAA